MDGRSDTIPEIPGAQENYLSLNKISEHIKHISDSSPLPFDVINKNIGVSVFRQNGLLNYFMKRIEEVDPSELIPSFPLDDFKSSYRSYLRAFKRIHNHILLYKSGDNRHTFFAGLALRWMRGSSLPQLINSSISYYKKKEPKKTVASIIRETMENIEDDLRFRYVKYLHATIHSSLHYTLKSKSLADYIEAIPDVPLYLEMGGSSGVTNYDGVSYREQPQNLLIEFCQTKQASEN